MAHQLAFAGYAPERIINVSKVTHRSPFRYPGGKTWFVPRVRRWLLQRDQLPAQFIEPFAGGAIVGLSIAFDNLAKHVTLVEMDAKVGAVWELVIEAGDAEWLAQRIEQYDLNVDNVEALLAQTPTSLRERAFQTVVHNRTSRGGIMAEGAGLIKHGDGKGIASRWYPETLARRIRDIGRIRDSLSFIQGDGLQVIADHQDAETVFFVDPPYTAGKGSKRAGRRLYTHADLDHERLFELLEGIQGDFLMTYENSEDLQEMARRHGFDFRPVAMKNTHHAKMTELVIGRDLDWLDV
jgi:DNA adenine methylase